MVLFFLLIQDTCPFFGECALDGAPSQHVTSHLLLMPFQIGLSVRGGPTGFPPTRNCGHSQCTKFDESGVS